MALLDKLTVDLTVNTSGEVQRILDRAPVWRDIAAERARQDALHGGAEADDRNEPVTWAGLRDEYENRALDSNTWEEGYLNVMKVAALAVAQLESMRRQMGDRLCLAMDLERHPAPLPRTLESDLAEDRG